MNCSSTMVGVCAVSLLVAGAALAQRNKPSPELVNELTQGLNITPEQATGGAGTLFQLAKSQLSPDDFNKISAVVPGMGKFLKAAPKTSDSPELSALGALPGGLGPLTSAIGAFGKLGLSPDMITKFLPFILKYIESKGGASLASVLSGGLKLASTTAPQ